MENQNRKICSCYKKHYEKASRGKFYLATPVLLGLTIVNNGIMYILLQNKLDLCYVTRGCQKVPCFKAVFLNLFGARTPQNFVKRFRTTYRIRLIQSNNKVKHNVACYRCIRVKRKLTVINRLIFINRNVAHNEKRN